MAANDTFHRELYPIGVMSCSVPSLKQRKDGGYYIHTPGDENPVNTFQTTNRGAELVKSSGRDLGEYFPDQLFFLLYDLGHLTTKGSEVPESIGQDQYSGEEVYENLTVEDRVDVAVETVDIHGVGALYTGAAATWILSLLGHSDSILRPLTVKIAQTAGYSYETILAYGESVTGEGKSLKVALCAFLQQKYLREEATFKEEDEHGDIEVLGATQSYVYLNASSEDTAKFGIPGDMPEPIDDDLQSELDEIWLPGRFAAGFAVLHSLEIEHRFGKENGLVIPKERIEDIPVERPPRSELTELYEAFRLLHNTIDVVLESEEVSVTRGDNSPCDRWHQEIQKVLNDEWHDGSDSLGVQQRGRVEYSTQQYRDCYGDGDQITDFAEVDLSQPSESDQLRLFGFGVFEHGEQVMVPLAPESETPLPVYPQTNAELDDAKELIAEFPTQPSTGSKAQED